MASPRLFDVISVAYGLDRNENAALVYEATHQFAWTEVVDPLSDYNIGNQRPESRMAVPGVTALRFVKPVTERANGVTDLPCRRGFTADCDDLLLMHAVTNDLAATAKCMCKLTRQEGRSEKRNHEKYLGQTVGHRNRTESL
jgi:hypothetical protein